MFPLRSLFSLSEETYDGTQLRSLFNYLEHGILGDSVVAWIGPCHIDFEHMVDGEDLRAQAEIAGDQMVHFIFELFDCSLLAAVSAQRLFASIVLEHLRLRAPNTSIAHQLRRDGDDIFFAEKKLSISIATVSPVSALIHFAVNVVNEGTPVATLSLSDLGVRPQEFAETCLKLVTTELLTIREATQKVRWVK
jgi:hypothetical protein